MRINPESDVGLCDIFNCEAPLPILTGTACALIFMEIHNEKNNINRYFMNADKYGCCGFAITVPRKFGI